QLVTELVPGALIAAKFRLERVIGKGGMGSVWAAMHMQLDMPVALKFMDPLADSPEARVRFEREAKSAAALRSPYVVQILDLGLAKLRAPGSGLDPNNQATQTGVVFGSPSYMSPEQARGVRVLDHRTDLWSLAVILFRSITGEKPFLGDSIGDLVIKLCIDP